MSMSRNNLLSRKFINNIQRMIEHEINRKKTYDTFSSDRDLNGGHQVRSFIGAPDSSVFAMFEINGGGTKVGR